MRKKLKKKYYAIHYIGNSQNFIVTDWNECQALMKGHNNMFKGFMTKEAATEWLTGITNAQEETHIKRVEQQKAAKKISHSTVEYRLHIDKKLSDDLQKKLQSIHISIDVLMNDLIREYLYGEG